MAKSCGPCFFAVGHGQGKLVLARGDWQGNVQQVTFMPVQTWVAESEILSLVGSAPHTQRGVAACLRHGATVHWGDSPAEQADVLCPELENPLAAFAGDGTLILLSNHEGRLCRLWPNRPTVHSFEWPFKAKPIAVVRGQLANEFAIIGEDGHIDLFRIQIN